MTLLSDKLQAISLLQSEKRRRAGRPPAITSVQVYSDEDTNEVIARAVEAGADISGTIVILSSMCTRAESARRRARFALVPDWDQSHWNKFWNTVDEGGEVA